MKWVVDTCVIIDILSGDEEFARPSALACDAKRDFGLIAAPITYIELAPSFSGDVREQDNFLYRLGVVCDFGGNRDRVLAAHKAWHEHILRKRAGDVSKRPVADVVIGALAMENAGLITRNEDDFRSLYPALNIYNPVRANI